MRTLALILALALLSGPLQAQARKNNPARKPATAPTAYVFDDDPMQGQSGFPKGHRIPVRIFKGRTLLIRPRAEFVQELRATVENM